MKSWEPIFAEISKLNDFDPKVREFRRYFLNGATLMEPDTAGTFAYSAKPERTCGTGKRYCAGFSSQQN